MHSFRERLRRKKFCITVELDPPKGANIDKTIREANSIKNWVDAVNIADSPMANMRMTPIALAHVVKRDTGLDTIFHLTCRDRNIIGLQAELLGAAALGVENILAITGDPPERGDHPGIKGVFEVDSTGLVRLASSLNNKRDFMGNELEKATCFNIGVAANPAAEDLEEEIDKLTRKVENGAHFAQTQPVYDLKTAERFIKKVEHLNIPILIGILPLKSYRMAKYLAEKVPGISVPENLIEAMRIKGRAAGIEAARFLISNLKDIADGIHIMPVNEIQMVHEVLEGIEVATRLRA